MNGQAGIKQDEAKQNASSVQQWREEVAEEVALHNRHGGNPGALIDSWIHNLTQDIDAKRQELWNDIVELHRLRAYRRKMED